MKYLELLKLLLAFGPKLQEVWPLILQAIELFKAIAAKIAPAAVADSGLQLVEATAEESQAEAELAQALSAPGSESAFDGSRLRSLIAIFQSLPELVGIFKTIIGLFPAK